MAKSVDHDYYKEFAESMAIKLSKEGNGLHKLDLQNTLTKHMSDESMGVSQEGLEIGLGHNRPDLQLENLSQLNKFRNNMLKLASYSYLDSKKSQVANQKNVEKLFDRAREVFIKDRNSLKSDLKSLDKEILSLEKHLEKQLSSDDKRVSRWAQHTQKKIDTLQASHNDDVIALQTSYNKQQIERVHDLKTSLNHQFIGDGIELFHTNNELNINLIENNVPISQSEKIYQALGEVGNLSKDMVANQVEQTLKDDGVQKAISNYITKNLEEWRVENPTKLKTPKYIIKEEAKKVSKILLANVPNNDTRSSISKSDLFKKRVDYIVEQGLNKFEEHDKNSKEINDLKEQALRQEQEISDLKKQISKSEQVAPVQEKEGERAKPKASRSNKAFVAKEDEKAFFVEDPKAIEEPQKVQLNVEAPKGLNEKLERARENVRIQNEYIHACERIDEVKQFLDTLPKEEAQTIVDLVDKDYTTKGEIDDLKLDKDIDYFDDEKGKLVGIRVKDKDFGTTDLNQDTHDITRRFK